MRIGAVAARREVTPRTIKDDEERGLLTPDRAGGASRDDDAEGIARVAPLPHGTDARAAIRELRTDRRPVGVRGDRALHLAEVEDAPRALEAHLAAVRRHLARDRGQVERSETFTAEVEAAIARCRERIARRAGVPRGWGGP